MGGTTKRIDVAFLLRSRVLPAESIEQIDAIMNRVLDTWNLELVSYWPVDTGHSLGQWSSVWEWPAWTITNTADYSEWVHRSGGSTGDAHEHMEREAMRLVREALPEMRAIVIAAGAPKDQPRRKRMAPLAPVSPFNLARGIERVGTRRERQRLRSRPRTR